MEDISSQKDLDSQHRGSNGPSFRSLVIGEERIRPVFLFGVIALTLFVEL